ncbi:MAG: zf-TFIIB domain-containing protein [Burkholderiaceae bacterium]
MKCPSCPDATLLMMDRQGVEIDYCPQCRGVWLDRGELDKLIERSTASPAGRAPAFSQQPSEFADSDHPGHYQSGYSRSSTGQPRKRKESWLSDIFD